MKMKFKIEKRIPCPKNKIRRGHRLKLPLLKMKKGDSIFVSSKNPALKLSGTQAVRNIVSQFAASSNAVFTVASVSNGVRVWRLK